MKRKIPKKFNQGYDKLNHIQWVAIILAGVFGLLFIILANLLYIS